MRWTATSSTELEAHLDDVPALPRRARRLCARSPPPWATPSSRRPRGCGPSIAVRLPERQGRRGAAADAAPRPPRPLALPDAGRRPAAAPHRDHHLGAIAVAAAAVAIVLGIGLVRADNKVSDLQSAQAAAVAGGHRCAHAPGPPADRPRARARTAQQAQVVVLPSGQGYLVSSTLPALHSGRTYQLWAIEGNSADLPGPAGRFAEPRRLHHGRIDTALAA